MRERISRGKRIDNGEWVEGFYAELPRPISSAASPMDRTIRDLYTVPCIISVSKIPYSLYCGRSPKGFVTITYEVISETVGDYTGLTDKNGKKVFEGDLFVPYTYGEKDNDFAGAIEKCGASFVLRSKNYADSRLDDYVEKIFSHYQPNVGEIFVPKNEVAQGEVIGTIYDNPELLEENNQ